ncbi:MAG TPA: hypothetical protein VMF89_16640, partial [Polyangiales bacterium]|nr:hypothetical protein [Polyangiales bacterium]
TKTGMLIGTPHYLAPEQLRARPVDRRTDIYGFGVLLYQTLAGELPFAADNFGDLVVEISVGTLRSLRELVPDLPVGVEHVVARAMAREPEQRYQSLHELIAGLQALDPTPLTAATLPQIAAPSTIRPISTVVPNTAARNGSRERTLVTVATVASLLAAAVGFAVLQQDRIENDESSAIVRPRELPSVVAPDTLPQSPSPFPQHDAAVDSGQPRGMEPVDTDIHVETKAPEPKRPVLQQPAQSGASAKSAEPKLAAPVKAPEPVKPVELQPLLQSAKPKPASPARAAPDPTIDQFDQDPQPSAADTKPERNPLHMDIQ